MNITYTIESFNDYWLELEPILGTVHAVEAAMLQDKTIAVLNPELFSRFEAQGLLHSIIVRADTAMIGYHISLLFDNSDLMLPDKTRYVKTAHVLKYFVYNHFRNQGIGSKLFRTVETSLKALGVELLMSEAKTKLPYARLFQHLNWQEEAVVFSKWIGE